MTRKVFKMTQEDYDKLMKACESVPLIMLNCGMPRSMQENANDAWCSLGDRMGFDGMTVKPGQSKLEFTAMEVPK